MSQYPSLTESAVKEALRHDKGEGAQLISWTVEDFLGEGDNYVSTVTSVRVKYAQEETREVSYVVKLQRKRLGDAPSCFDNMTFGKEGKFLTELLPLLNAALTSAGLTPLRAPRCFHSTWSEGQEYLFLEDLRTRGFQRYDRKKELDALHTNLVLQELARMHAASFLLPQEIREDLATKFGFLGFEWHNYSDEARKEFKTLLEGSLQNTSALASSLGYESVAEWFTEKSRRGCETVEEQLEGGPWDVVGHGDFCTNNIMFRYNDAGHPVEVMFVDYQVCRLASPAIDLNYFIFSSLTRTNRITIEEQMSKYYSTLASAVRAGGRELPFTEEDLRREFKRKNTFGFIYGSILIPVMVAESHEVVALEGDMEDFVKDLEQNAARMLANNPKIKMRLRDLFQDMVEVLEL